MAMELNRRAFARAGVAVAGTAGEPAGERPANLTPYLAGGPYRR